MKGSQNKGEALRDNHMWNRRAEAVRDPLFQDHPEFFDARDLVQVKYEMLRRVHQDGHTVTQASDAFGLSRQAFYHTQAAWEAEGITGLVPKRSGPRRAHKLSEVILSAAYAAHQAHPTWSYADLTRWVTQEFTITVHPRSLARALRDRNRT